MDGVGDLKTMIETCYTLEPPFNTYYQEDGIFTSENTMVYLLGKELSNKGLLLYVFHALTADGIEEVKKYVRSRLWFTYRKNFAPIGGTGPDSDQGWGCMLRCAQMLFGETLLRRHIGKHVEWPEVKEREGEQKKTYEEILRMFFDEKKALYSIHQIAQMGVTEGKAVGEWIGPNTAAQVLKKLAIFDNWSKIAVHVALDNILVKEDVEIMARLQIPDDAVKIINDDRCFNESTISKLNDSLSQIGIVKSYSQVFLDPNYWRPLLIIVPLRLGLTAINRCYLPAIKEYFKLQSCVGIIGGRPNHALYFVGIAGERLLYLDPHYCRPSLDPQPFDDSSYHCNMLLSMNYDQVDPSLALAFYCQTAEEFKQLSLDLTEKVFPASKPPIFEQLDKRPHYWPQFEPYTGVKAKIEMKEFENMGDPSYSIDEDFTILGDEDSLLNSENC